MPNYTLHYFNGRGRAEILRMMMAIAGIKYLDKRYEFSDWDRCRNDFPCRYLPCLQMDNGDMMPETMAICRYLAREYGFYPKSVMDMFRCDYISDCMYEIMHDYMRYLHWKNGRFRLSVHNKTFSNKEEVFKAFEQFITSKDDHFFKDGIKNLEYNMNDYGFGGEGNCSNYDNYMQWRYMNTFNRVMPFMERTLCMRNGGNNFFMGDMMMWCDMMFYCCLENMFMENQSMFSSYPKLMALYNRIASHPKIASYLKSRSNTCW